MLRSAAAIHFVNPLVIWFGALLYLPAAVSAQNTQPNFFSIVMLSPDDRLETYDALFENVKAQMTDLPVRLRMVPTDALPGGSPGDNETSANRLLAEKQADLVFWCNVDEGRNVYFAIRSRQGVRMMVRDLRGSGKDGLFDAVSLITRTTVETLIEIGEMVEESSLDEAKSVRKTIETGTDASSLSQTAKARTLFFRAAIRAAYAPQWVSFAPPSVSHGGRCSLLLLFNDLIVISVGATIRTPVTAQTETVALTQMQVPFHLGLRLAGTVGNWRIGGGLSAVFALIKLSPESLSETVIVDPPFHQFGFSSEAAAEVEYRLADRVGFFLGGGIEILFNKIVYGVTNGPTLFEDTARIQPKLWVGITVFLL